MLGFHVTVLACPSGDGYFATQHKRWALYRCDGSLAWGGGGVAFSPGVSLPEERQVCVHFQLAPTRRAQYNPSRSFPPPEHDGGREVVPRFTSFYHMSGWGYYSELRGFQCRLACFSGDVSVIMFCSLLLCLTDRLSCETKHLGAHDRHSGHSDNVTFIYLSSLTLSTIYFQVVCPGSVAVVVRWVLPCKPGHPMKSPPPSPPASLPPPPPVEIGSNVRHFRHGRVEFHHGEPGHGGGAASITPPRGVSYRGANCSGECFGVTLPSVSENSSVGIDIRRSRYPSGSVVIALGISYTRRYRYLSASIY